MIDLEVNNIVKVPFDGVGIIRKIKNQIWGSKYIVEIIQTKSPFYSVGDVEDFKLEHLIKIDI